MTWLLGGLALLLLLAMLLWGFATASVAQVRRTGAVLLAIVGLLAFVLLLLSGRLLPAMPALLPLLPLALRLWRGWRSARRFGAPGGAGAGTRETVVETAMLIMRLDLESGSLSGRVRQGRWVGRELGEMPAAEVLALRAECQAADLESVPLLETWLDRAHPGWRRGAPPEGTSMDRAAALSLLGLGEGASAAEIRAAHRRLMRQAHPDHGGSAEQAARLNHARDILLH